METEPARFLVNEPPVTVTGRGTCVIGFIESGVVRIGQLLHVERDGVIGASVVCEGVEGVRVANWSPDDPAPVGLVLPGLEQSEIAKGDFLVSPPDTA